MDAIWINQQDDKEKSVQPPLMGSIYTFAETVWVWWELDRMQPTRLRLAAAGIETVSHRPRDSMAEGAKANARKGR